MTRSFFVWRRGWPLALLGLVPVLVLWAWPRRPGSTRLPASQAWQQALAPANSTRLRGVSWVGGDSVTAADLAPLAPDHVTWLAQVPFGWQDGVAMPAVQLHTARPGGQWG